MAGEVDLRCMVQVKSGETVVASLIVILTVSIAHLVPQHVLISIFLSPADVEVAESSTFI
jgi:hypothetical protein